MDIWYLIMEIALLLFSTGEKLAMEVMGVTHAENRDALGCALAGKKP